MAYLQHHDESTDYEAEAKPIYPGHGDKPIVSRHDDGPSRPENDNESIWSDNGSVDSRDSRDDLRDALPTTLPELLCDLDVQFEDLQFLNSGAFHFVYSFKNIADSLKYVVRVAIEKADSNYSHELGMDDHAAVLRFLEPYEPHLAYLPKTFHFNASNDNKIGRPYMIQRFISGQRICEVWDDLSLADQKNVLVELAEFINAQDGITFSQSGTLCSPRSTMNNDSDEAVEVGPFKYPWDKLDTTWDRNISVREWLLYLLDHQREREVTFGRSAKIQEACFEELRNIERIVHEMSEVGMFEDPEQRQTMSNAVLSHTDLHFANIFVSQNPITGKLKISGVIDWDFVDAVPPMMRPPPYWLWYPDAATEDDELIQRWNGNYDFLPDHYWNSMTEEDRFRRDIFEERMQYLSPHYMEDTYGAGLWIRRVANFAMWATRQSLEHCMIEWLCDEWIWFLWSNYGIRSKVTPSEVDPDEYHMMPPRPPPVDLAESSHGDSEDAKESMSDASEDKTQGNARAPIEHIKNLAEDLEQKL